MYTILYNNKCDYIAFLSSIKYQVNLETPMHKKVQHISTIKSILTNEKYKGDALLQKQYTVDFLTKKRKTNEGEIPQYYVTDNHEPIIDKKTFDLVQIERDKRKNKSA